MGIPFFFQRENSSKTRFNLFKENNLTNKYTWHLFYEYLSTYRKSNHSFHLSRFFHTILALQLVLLAWQLSAHFDEIKNCKKNKNNQSFDFSMLLAIIELELLFITDWHLYAKICLVPDKILEKWIKNTHKYTILCLYK